MDVPLLAKAIPRAVSLDIDYRELIDIIEKYVVGSYSQNLLVETDSLITTLS